MERLIETFTKPGDTILDPYAGSGSTLIAARNLGRKAIGVEIEAGYVAVAESRLQIT
jgi:site-specific DNA-methyltransferase (adenine-specific)